MAVVRRTAYLACSFLFLLAVQTAAAGGPAIEWATPDQGTYEVEGHGSFEIEVECMDDPEGDKVYAVYFAAGEPIDAERDIWGGSPSYTFQVAGPGTYEVAVGCYDENDETAGDVAAWTLVVPQPQAAPETEAGGEPRAETGPETNGLVCPELVLPTPLPEAAGEARRVQTIALETPSLMERPDLLCASEEVYLVAHGALMLTTPFVNTKTNLEEFGIGETNAWNALLTISPELGLYAETFETVHELLLATEALSAFGEDMNQVVEATHTFLAEPTDPVLEATKAVYRASLPAYYEAIAQIETTAQEVDGLADPARDLMALLPALRAEVDEWTFGKATAHQILDALEAFLQTVLDTAETAASTIDAIADGPRASATAMEAALNPPQKDAPGLPLALVLAALAAVALAQARHARRPRP